MHAAACAMPCSSAVRFACRAHVVQRSHLCLQPAGNLACNGMHRASCCGVHVCFCIMQPAVQCMCCCCDSAVCWQRAILSMQVVLPPAALSAVQAAQYVVLSLAYAAHVPCSMHFIMQLMQGIAVLCAHTLCKAAGLCMLLCNAYTHSCSLQVLYAVQHAA